MGDIEQFEASLNQMDTNRSSLRDEWNRLSSNISNLLDRYDTLQQQETQESQRIKELQEELRNAQDENNTKERNIEELNKNALFSKRKYK